LVLRLGHLILGIQTSSLNFQTMLLPLELLVLYSYKHGQTLNCVNVNRKSSRHMKRMKKLGATPMIPDTLLDIAIRTPSEV
jgi:hypothetical protein